MPRTTNKKHDIINTSLDLVLRDGFSRLSLDAVCNAAEVKKGSLYYYIESKDILGTQIIEEYQAAKINALHSLLNLDPIGKIEYYLDWHFEISTRSDNFGLLAALLPELNSLPDKMKMTLRQLFDLEIKWVRDAIVEGQSVGLFQLGLAATELADLVVAHAIGAQNVTRLLQPTDRATIAQRCLLDLLRQKPSAA